MTLSWQGAPHQYAVGRKCSECPTILSRYNPYTICGACRVRIVAQGPREWDGDLTDPGVEPFPWEGQEREPVRRGPLLDETALDGPGAPRRVA